jgi:uncharacterized membrane protein YbhN (UPF0104 family)
VLAWSVATGLVVLSLGRVDWSAVGGRVAAAHPGWLVAALVANAGILMLWAVQWRLFVPPSRPVSLGRMLDVTAAMALVCNSVPFFAGQVTGLHLLATRGGVGHAAALSVTALDQLAEGTAKLAVLLLLAAVIPLPPDLRSGLLALLVGVTGLAVVLVLLSRRAGWLRGAARAARTRWIGDLLRFASEGARHLRPLGRPRTVAAGAALALGMKAAEAGGILAVQHALGVTLPLWTVPLVLASVNLATMVSLAPANLGVYEAAAFVAYRWAGVPAETALGLALIQHLCFLVPMLGCGWVAVSLWERGTGRRGHGARRRVASPAGAGGDTTGD